jgi:thymidylate synthase (FAD)
MQNNVELIGYYGGDKTHSLSAWTSTCEELGIELPENVPDRVDFIFAAIVEMAKKKNSYDQLLFGLANAGHHTPFEKSLLHFTIRCDTASHIHLLKHRIGVSINGESARYKELKEPTAYIPPDWPPDLAKELEDHYAKSVELYRKALAQITPIDGRARAKESARFFLPYSNQLTLDVSMNFRSFMHFLGLRKKPEAQTEIREIAREMVRQVGNIDGAPFRFSLAAFNY